MRKLNVDPLLIMFIALGVIITFVGFSISTTVQHGNEVKLILEEEEKQGEARTEQLQLIKRILQQQGNLSEESRLQIIDNIIENNEVTIPQINQALEELGENQTKLLLGHEQLIRGLLNGTVK